MSTNNAENNWIATRELIPRWPVAISGLANLVALLIAVFAIWWIFFSNTGVFKLYTPLLGFSLVIWTLLIILWQTELFDFWPFKRKFLNDANPLAKGAVFTAITILLYLILVIGIVYFVIGQLGVTYFNWHSLMKYGEIGQDAISARETASWAMISLSVPFFLISVWFMFGIGDNLFPELKQPKRGIATIGLIAVIGIVLYAIFFHPHIGSMFYPKQIYAAVPPWWQGFAHTNSSEFSLGILFCSVVGVFYAFHMWDGQPFNLVKKQPWRFIFFAVMSLIIGYVIIFQGQLFIFDYLWDKAYAGGQNEMNFGWRYSHTVTMANFVLVIAIMQNVFFGKAYIKLPGIVRGIIKTVVAVAVGLLFAWAYYKWAPSLLGVCEGISHPSENAAAFLLMVINLLMIQDYFMDGWPGYKLKKQ
jgi:AAT family amino acid transporter